MITGRIIRGVGSFYDVILTDQTVIRAQARGKLRKDHLTPLVGDLAEVSPHSRGHWSIESLLPRKNLLIRPPVSNIDQMLIVLSADLPVPDFLLADKLILSCILSEIDPVLVLNKMDLSDRLLETVQIQYASFPVIPVSAREGWNLDRLQEILRGKISCLSGQSAVGKSSLINSILPEIHLETGELSEKIGRGKNTTRHAELIPCMGGALLDTPGFSLLEFQYDPGLAQLGYPEFAAYSQFCRFRECSHVSEPDCGVRNAVSDGKIDPERYERYTEIYRELSERRKHQYD